MWEFPKIGGTILGVPIIRTIVYLGLYWGPLILGNYHVAFPGQALQQWDSCASQSWLQMIKSSATEAGQNQKPTWRLRLIKGLAKYSGT